jgi:hypothetical protein
MIEEDTINRVVLATDQRIGRLAGTSLPSIFTTRTQMRDLFSSHIRNPNTHHASREGVRQFSGFCAEHGIVDLAQVERTTAASESVNHCLMWYCTINYQSLMLQCRRSSTRQGADPDAEEENGS